MPAKTHNGPPPEQTILVDVINNQGPGDYFQFVVWNQHDRSVDVHEYSSASPNQLIDFRNQ
ncbi:MAG TPA: hypothetical protein VJM12_20060 [Pyrinomonadaceae bacterium]|nr:hypothetical protein [Pyrinomonadaceae bacterium]